MLVHKSAHVTQKEAYQLYMQVTFAKAGPSALRRSVQGPDAMRHAPRCDVNAMVLATRCDVSAMVHAKASLLSVFWAGGG